MSVDQDGQKLVQVIPPDLWAICSSWAMISGSQMPNNRNKGTLSIKLDLKTESGVLFGCIFFLPASTTIDSHH